MKQTKKLNPNFRADLIIKYKKENGLTFDDILQLLSDIDKNVLNVNGNTFRQYIYGSIKTVPMYLLQAMAKLVGVTFDYFCYNTKVNDIDTEIQNKLGFSIETTDNVINNKPNKWLFNADKKPKEISKKDYNAILNLFLEKKIKSGIGKKSAIDVFTTNMLNLFICTTIYDKTLLETFKENFDKLSFEINQNKIQPIGKNDIDNTFTEIFNSPTIQKVYRNATNELHDTIDKLLETILKETFDNIKPNKTLL